MKIDLSYIRNRVVVDRKTGCWNWTKWTTVNGYARISFRDAGKTRQVNASHVAFQETNGKIPKGMLVCHRCDNPLCCNPKHLFCGTPLDNINDSKNKNGWVMGVKNGNSKSSKEDIVNIRKDLGKLADIGRLYGLHVSVISRIKNRKSYVNIP